MRPCLISVEVDELKGHRLQWNGHWGCGVGEGRFDSVARFSLSAAGVAIERIPRRASTRHPGAQRTVRPVGSTDAFAVCEMHVAPLYGLDAGEAGAAKWLRITNCSSGRPSGAAEL